MKETKINLSKYQIKKLRMLGKTKKRSVIVYPTTGFQEHANTSCY